MTRDALAAAWGDSALAETRRGLSRRPLRMAAVQDLLDGFLVVVVDDHHGGVDAVLVAEGATVDAGDVLVQLNTADVQPAVSQAEAALAGVQAQRDLLQAGARPEEIAVLHAQLTAATAAGAARRAEIAAEFLFDKLEALDQFPLGSVPEASVGEDPVDIEHHQPNLRQTVALTPPPQPPLQRDPPPQPPRLCPRAAVGRASGSVRAWCVAAVGGSATRRPTPVRWSC